MIYKLLKFPARLAFLIYCRHLKANNKALFRSEGPLLIASNHPNSFLDAVILATLFRRPIYSLARGDAFANNFYTRLLTSLNIYPVYRVSEGVENLEHNYTTFNRCEELFKRNGIVLIFSEGRCINEWHLRPLKKGTARLATSAWQQNIPLKVLPIGINYQSFHSFGKNIQLNFGTPITETVVDNTNGFGKNVQDFNNALRIQLEGLVEEIDSRDNVSLKNTFVVDQSIFKKVILFIPSVAGYIIHAPLYLPIKNLAWKKAKLNDHYDSAMMGLLFITYPLYLLLISLILFFVTSSWYSFSAILVLPFFAWSYVQLKKQF
jgi:1-acyl-sn-glycerol-3-phosphate acyltransferase